MLQEYTKDIAKQNGLNLSRVSIFEGHKVGCIDVHLVNIACGGKTVSTLVYQSDLDNLNNGLSCNLLEIKIQSALSRLKIMLEP